MTTEKLDGRILVDSYYELKKTSYFLKFLHECVFNGTIDDCGPEILDELITGMLPRYQACLESAIGVMENNFELKGGAL